eukprot:1545544-Lingulodinium_polyedra.AAC.1
MLPVNRCAPIADADTVAGTTAMENKDGSMRCTLDGFARSTSIADAFFEANTAIEHNVLPLAMRTARPAVQQY